MQRGDISGQIDCAHKRVVAALGRSMLALVGGLVLN